MMSGLSDRDKSVLDTEKRSFRTTGHKVNYVTSELGMTWTRYNMLLNRIIDTQEALEYDPVLVHRLQRVREQNVRSRSSV